eukprot:TRINITY_DN6979_c0_g1_i1.p1 TRINITY_DN6979_c0_g1~~TRINITY_DN6979_c0_g1_i1.p1  ORF type:complete len:375 (-),score=23.47 TRINITY_DN6979_c0_g1_i1:43-1095(-)
MESNDISVESIEDISKDESAPILVKPVYSNGIFNNPWDSWTDTSISFILKFAVSKKPKRPKPWLTAKELDEHLPVLRPDFKILSNPDEERLTVTWLGHASTLVQMEGINFLTDPVYGQRASPVSFAGPKRYRDPPCKLDELPPISFIVISHDHYDHLDIEVVRHYANSVHWFVPLGLKKWFASCGVTNVTELNWWESATFAEVQVVCLPAQHWSKRTVTSSKTTLWSGWAVIGKKKRVYYAGDTGYCSVFKTIGEVYGPFDFSMIPIGCYTPREFMKAQHIDPEEAVTIHQEIKSRFSLGVHWGTYAMGVSSRYEPEDEPPQKLAEALSKRGLSSDEFITCFSGKTFVVP